jgi:hypothetical protein
MDDNNNDWDLGPIDPALQAFVTDLDLSALPGQALNSGFQIESSSFLVDDSVDNFNASQYLLEDYFMTSSQLHVGDSSPNAREQKISDNFDVESSSGRIAIPSSMGTEQNVIYDSLTSGQDFNDSEYLRKPGTNFSTLQIDLDRHILQDPAQNTNSSAESGYSQQFRIDYIDPRNMFEQQPQNGFRNFPQQSNGYIPQPTLPEQQVNDRFTEPDGYRLEPFLSQQQTIDTIQQTDMRTTSQKEWNEFKRFQQRRKRQRKESHDSQELEEVLSEPESPAKKVKTAKKDCKGLEDGEKNCRPMNIRNVNPTMFYAKVFEKRHSWMAGNRPYSQQINYTEHGEIDLATTFTPMTFIDFVNYHPYLRRHNGLTLWIQCVPADSAKRYPTKNSSRCRFANCPVGNKTIRKGEFRVTIDEWEWHREKARKDPFHNAGYVHLYCLEKFSDFNKLCAMGIVKPDTRGFAEATNKMSINRDHIEMEDICKEHIASAPQIYGLDMNGVNVVENWFEKSLTKKLTKYHLKNQPEQRQSVRNERGGNNISTHLNNLDVMVFQMGRHEKKKGKQPHVASPPRNRKVGGNGDAPAPRGRKPKRSVVVEEDNYNDVSDHEILRMPRQTRNSS